MTHPHSQDMKFKCHRQSSSIIADESVASLASHARFTACDEYHQVGILTDQEFPVFLEMKGPGSRYDVDSTICGHGVKMAGSGAQTSEQRQASTIRSPDLSPLNVQTSGEVAASVAFFKTEDQEQVKIYRGVRKRFSFEREPVGISLPELIVTPPSPISESPMGMRPDSGTVPSSTVESPGSEPRVGGVTWNHLGHDLHVDLQIPARSFSIGNSSVDRFSHALRIMDGQEDSIEFGCWLREQRMKIAQSGIHIDRFKAETEVLVDFNSFGDEMMTVFTAL